MINYNGTLFEDNNVPIPFDNRAFSYGDSVFDTLKVIDNKILFIEEHYFRLMASMRMLRMEIPVDLTLGKYQIEITKTFKAVSLSSAKVKVQIVRTIGGLYTPTTNQIDFIISAKALQEQPNNDKYTLDLFKDYYVTGSLLSTIKSTNKLVNVLASIYAKENNLSNCVLINEKKQVVEVTNGNIFLVKGDVISTPSLKSGCLNGIIRKQVIKQIPTNTNYKIEEKEISPFDLLKADAIFVTNSLINIKAVSNYRKKVFDLSIVENLKRKINLV